MNIRMLDHLIVSDGGYYSYADEARLRMLCMENKIVIFVLS